MHTHSRRQYVLNNKAMKHSCRSCSTVILMGMIRKGRGKEPFARRNLAVSNCVGQNGSWQISVCCLNQGRLKHKKCQSKTQYVLQPKT